MANIIGAQNTGLIDRFGMPIVRDVMENSIALATLGGVRQAVGGAISGGLTPSDLADILIAAEQNEPEPYLRLAEEMEEKEPQYISVLGVRKRQVSQLEVHLEAASKEPLDKAIAGAVQEHLIDSGLVDGAMFDMLDAVGKGFSEMEITWDMSNPRLWKPKALMYVDPRFFRFDLATRRQPLLLGDGGQWLPLPAYKFLHLELKAKSGIPIRGGLARPIAWCWMFKNFGTKDWVQFLDVYGIPFRLGKFPPGATDTDVRRLLQAVTNIASDAAAVVPSNMDITFAEANVQGAANAHDTFCRYMDGVIAKLVLGQTGTTDSSGAHRLGSGSEHTEVREDIQRADAKALATCFNRDLIKPFVDLNYGPQQRYPWLWIGQPDAKDGALLVDAAQKLVPLGLRIRAADIRNAIGASEPEAGDEVLAPPAVPAPVAGGTIPGSPKVPTISPTSPTLQSMLAHLLSAEIGGGRDAIQQAADAQLADWREITGPVADQVLQLAREAKGADDAARFADFRKRLEGLYLDADMNPLAERLSRLMLQAYGAGATGDRLE